MTEILVDEATLLAGDVEAEPLSPWRSRAAAYLADVVPGVALTTTFGLVALTVPFRGVWWWVCVSISVAAILATALNRLVIPAATGQSIGRAVFGIAVVGDDGRPLSSVRLVAREFAHLLDTAPALAGWIWPLWDSRNRTFADMLVGSESHLRAPIWPQAGIRRLSTALVCLSAALCAGGAAVSYLAVGRHDDAAIAAKAEIQVRGPEVVEQVLTYHPESIQQDFDRAQSLATDNYRAELSAEQAAVRKAGRLRAEYWVTNSAVVSADSAAATMLLFLQGETGIDKDRRLIAAPVRATFVKSGHDWRLDGLTAVTTPQKGSQP